ncbi:MAG: hypothetical protein M1834_007886 [Cirrosporium novae-zelandiae]|nr:MAG: hypothetical protein M1834_007886 [Cirrosporium novae-zelandiae]
MATESQPESKVPVQSFGRPGITSIEARKTSMIENNANNANAPDSSINATPSTTPAATPKPPPSTASIQPERHTPYSYQEALNQPVRKRRRVALSCAPCRNRKLKCDRGVPSCERCIKSGYPEDCIYSNNIPEHTSFDRREHENGAVVGVRQSSSAGWSPQVSRVSYGGDLPHAGESTNYRRLEGLLLGSEHPRAPGYPTPLSLVDGLPFTHENDPHRNDGASRVLPEMSLCRGKNSKTKFYGCSHPSGLMSPFTELRSLIHELKAKSPLLDRVRYDIAALKKHRPQVDAERGGFPTDKASMINLVPPRETADELIALYFDRFESTHRILHIPTFHTEYNRFWQNPESSQASYVVQLLLMMACVITLHGSGGTSFIGTSSPARDTAMRWIKASEQWVNLSGLKRPDLSILQIYCLLVRARQANNVGLNQIWTFTGILLRLAMSSGYHCEPSGLAKISPFYQEMRRRIWATAVELDLEASLDRGMPPSISQSDYDCQAPLNINDNDLVESAIELPASRPDDILTDTSYQVTLFRSMPLRLQVVSVVNSLHIQLPYEDLLLLDEKVAKCISNIPDWVGEGGSRFKHEFRLHQQRILEITLRRYLLALHTPFALQSQKYFKFVHSRRACLETSTIIISLQRALVDAGDVSFFLYRNEAILAATSICCHLYITPAGNTTVPSKDILPEYIETLLRLVEKVLFMIETRIAAVGKGLKEFWFLSMIIALVKSRLWPEGSERYKAEGLDRGAKIAYNLLSWQQHYHHTTESETDTRRDQPIQQPTPNSDHASSQTYIPQVGVDLPNPDDFSFLADNFGFDMYGFWDPGELFDL